MNKKLALIAVGLAMVVSSTAMADHRNHNRYDSDSYDYDFYVGLSAGWVIYQEDGINTLMPTVVVLRFGQNFNPYVGIEGRVGTGIRGDEANGMKATVQAVYGGYVKGTLPFSAWFSGYGLAGVAGVQMHRNYPDSNTNDGGLSVGLGVEVKLGRGASLNTEWVRITTRTNNQVYDYTADQWTFGVNWRW
jgi:Outer membrane protein beta-barrel domain